MDATRDDAFYLDLDGTLIETTPTPEMARAGPRVRHVLARLVAATRGATMIVSGRAIAKVDELLCMRLPTAGQHGAEIRLLNPAFDDVRVGIEDYPAVLARCAALHARIPGSLLEAKDPTVALHLRRADPRFDELVDGMRAIAKESGGRLACVLAHDVAELRPADIHKGKVLAGAALFAPFSGRRPIFIGNDTPDIDGFRAASGMGGYGVAVGIPCAAARFRLASPDAVLDALDAVAEAA